jgi:hypothetical protein
VGDEDRWAKVREIVREECERIEARILAVISKHKTKVELVNGKWSGISEELKGSWALAYPAVDIQVELNKAAAWIMSNPTLAPKQQVSRFLLTWFSRTQDRLSIRSIPTRNETPPAPNKKLCSYCAKVATSSPNRIWACDEHMMNAMHHEPVPMFKSGVTAKPVSGS